MRDLSLYTQAGPEDKSVGVAAANSIATAPTPDTIISFFEAQSYSSILLVFQMQEETALAYFPEPFVAEINREVLNKNEVYTPATPDTILAFHEAISYRDWPYYPLLYLRTNGILPPLAISGVQAINITKNSADIHWHTNLNANSAVDYGRDSTYGLYVADLEESVMVHTLHLSGLTPGTTYHFRVKSRSAETGELVWSDDYTFNTLADSTGDPTTPETQMHASVITIFFDEPTGRKDYSYEGLSVDNDSLV